MKKLLILLLLQALLCSNAFGAERKDIGDINIDALIHQTQSSPAGANSKHIALVWWIPLEFWKQSLSDDPKVDAKAKARVVNAFNGVALIAVVQADVSPLGSFDYYPQEETRKHLVVVFTDAHGNKHQLKEQSPASSDLTLVLGLMKPLLTGAMGNLGSNLNFFVFDDQNEHHERLVDPYQPGSLGYEIADRTGKLMHGDIEVPLDALFVPRKCPNGEDAHVSWKYCPWDGTPLKD